MLRSLALVALLGPLSAQASRPAAHPDYFPLALGMAWRVVDSRDGTMVCPRVRLSRVGLAFGSMAERSKGLLHWWLVTREGVYIVTTTDPAKLRTTDLVHQDRCLSLPLGIELSWRSSQVQADRVIETEYTLEALSETVEVAAGTFCAARLCRRSEDMPPVRWWLAPGAGIVKASHGGNDEDGSGGTVTYELAEFRPPPKFAPEAAEARVRWAFSLHPDSARRGQVTALREVEAPTLRGLAGWRPFAITAKGVVYTMLLRGEIVVEFDPRSSDDWGSLIALREPHPTLDAAAREAWQRACTEVLGVERDRVRLTWNGEDVTAIEFGK